VKISTKNRIDSKDEVRLKLAREWELELSCGVAVKSEKSYIRNISVDLNESGGGAGTKGRDMIGIGDAPGKVKKK